MVQPYDYRHLNGNSGISTLLPLTLSQSPEYVSASFSMALRRTIFRPFFVGDEGLTISRLGVYWGLLNNVTAGAQYTLAVYDNAPPGDLSVYPRNLLQAFGPTNVPSVTNLSPGEFAWTATHPTPLVLPSGLYWTLATLPAATGTRYWAWAEQMSSVEGSGPLLTYTACGYFSADVLFGLPATVPSGLGRLTSGVEDDNVIVFAE